MKYTVLIPAYKPDDKLIVLIDNLLAHNLDIVVVNDGSAPEYETVFDEVRNRNVPLLVHAVNRGKGAALKTGIRHIMKDPEGAGIVTADADGQHTCEDIIRVMDELAKDDTALVLGVRRFGGKNVPIRSKIGNWTTIAVFYIVSGQKVTDTQTGLRGLPRSLFPKLAELEGDRYEYEMNMLLNVRNWHSHFVEIPIKTVYIDENKGSSYNTWRDTWLILRQILKYCASSLISTLVDYALYMTLCWLFPTISLFNNSPISTVAVWIIVSRAVASILNYSINRYAVFKGSSTASFLKFAALVCFGILVSASCVSGLVHLGVNEVLAKIMIDIPLFVLNYYIQNRFIFNKKTAK